MAFFNYNYIDSRFNRVSGVFRDINSKRGTANFGEKWVKSKKYRKLSKKSKKSR